MKRDTVLTIYRPIGDLKKARTALGSPAELNEALVATGIDALFWLLDGGAVQIEGRTYRLQTVLETE